MRITKKRTELKLTSNQPLSHPISASFLFLVFYLFRLVLHKHPETISTQNYFHPKRFAFVESVWNSAAHALKCKKEGVTEKEGKGKRAFIYLILRFRFVVNFAHLRDGCAMLPEGVVCSKLYMSFIWLNIYLYFRPILVIVRAFAHNQPSMNRKSPVTASSAYFILLKNAFTVEYD